MDGATTKKKRQVNKFKFLKHLIYDNPVRRTKETFDGLEKINSCYQNIARYEIIYASSVNAMERIPSGIC